MKKVSKFTMWDEVAIALREIAEINNRVSAAEVVMNSAIDEIKENYDKKVSGDLERKAELEKDIELYVKAHQSEFTEKKSREFTFGKVGFRKSTEIVTRNIRAIIEALKAHGMNDCIVVTERIDKNALEKYDDRAILAVGAKRKEGETYFCEVKEEKLV